MKGMGGSVFRRRYYAHVSLCKGYLKGRVDDKGFFAPAQNRLQCGDVIENVSKSDYDRAISGDKQTTLAEAMKEIFIR
ncbi:hypothetical protein NIHE120848_46490 [Klebsiella pneumoniae]|nr:hypothetical protein NIHE120848_46490 [Klebsiella pneumoniae]GJK77454.1 hypothetical protein TUM17565_46670 [Klebsiella pneumoniae]